MSIAINATNLKKGLFVLAVLLASWIVFSSAYFYYNKDSIARSLILRLNDMQNGEMSFQNISFSPIAHFPQVSLSLEKLNYYEQKESEIRKDALPIASFEKVDLSFNVIDLIQGNVNTSKVYFNQGKVRVVVYPDSSINLINATKSQKVEKKKTVETEPSAPFDINLLLEGLEIRQLELSYYSSIDHKYSEINIASLNASFLSNDLRTECRIVSSILLKELQINPQFKWANEKVDFDTHLLFDRERKLLTIFPSKCDLQEVTLTMAGEVGVAENSFVNVKLEGGFEDFKILDGVFSKRGIDNIESGQLYFSGTIKGDYQKELPSVNCIFGIKDIQIGIPKTDRKVTGINLAGSFNSGNQYDLSKAKIKIERITATFPSGQLNGQLELNNLPSPFINGRFNFTSDIEYLDEITTLKNVDFLSGSVDFRSAVKGNIDFSNFHLSDFIAKAKLKLNNVSLNTLPIGTIKNINGVFQLNDHEFSVDSFSLAKGKSSLKIPRARFLTNKKILKTKRNDSSVFIFDFLKTFEWDMNASIDTEDFDSLFQYMGIDSVSGSLSLKSNISGDILAEKENIIDAKGLTSIDFSKVSFGLKNTISINNMTGLLEIDGQKVALQDLSAQYGKSDFLINGQFPKPLDYWFEKQKPLKSSISIQCNSFDFPDFFSWDPKTARAFPYVLQDLDLQVTPTLKMAEITQFEVVPKINFEIQKLYAQIVGFLPPLAMNEGTFLLHERDSTLLLDFSDFDISLAGAQIDANVNCSFPKNASNSISIQTRFIDVNPKKVFAEWFSDSVPEMLEGRLAAEASLDLTLGRDSLLFEEFLLTGGSFVFQQPNDTVVIKGMKVQTGDLHYNRLISSNLLETLTTTMEVSAEETTSNYFATKDLKRTISVSSGSYHIPLSNSKIFNYRGAGYLSAQPFLDTPTYTIKYKVDDFEISPLLETFNSQKVLSGLMSLNLELSMSGASKKALLQSVDGKMIATGHDLTMYGVEIDVLIERFKRSQRFTAADIGAAFLMGPTGLLFTKGSDYATMVTIKKGTTSKIINMSSSWQFEKGILKLSDVAFTTSQNRMAARGWINLNDETLHLDIALLDAKGCSLFSQNIKGSIENPELGRVKVVKMITAPVSNLFHNLKDDHCTPFYEEVVEHPVNQ